MGRVGGNALRCMSRLMRSVVAVMHDRNEEVCTTSMPGLVSLDLLG